MAVKAMIYDSNHVQMSHASTGLNGVSGASAKLFVPMSSVKLRKPVILQINERGTIGTAIV